MLDANSALTSVVVLTADPDFEQMARAAFAASAQINLSVVRGDIVSEGGKLGVDTAAVVIVDLDASQADQLQALEGLMRRIGRPPVVVVTPELDTVVLRKLMQMQVADYLTKPVTATELVTACAKVARASAGRPSNDAKIYTFLAAVGGAGATTLAIQAALTLHASGTREASSTCLVDLNFEHSVCADYLDLEPRLDLSEIEPRPERLDRQLLQVMLSRHSSGLAVIAAQSRPAEMRSFNPIVVTRLLDLVSSHFDNVVVDLPQVWFPWTDSVLRGSDKLFIVGAMTVPALRRAKQLATAISQRLGATPRVIVNRYRRRLFSPGLGLADVRQALGDAFGGVVPARDQLAREAVDRGVPLEEVQPGNKIATALKKLIVAGIEAEAKTAKATPAAKASRLSFAH